MQYNTLINRNNLSPTDSIGLDGFHEVFILNFIRIFQKNNVQEMLNIYPYVIN